LALVIDLGHQHVATHVVSGVAPGASGPKYPLELVRCAGEDGCGLVQLRHTLDSSTLYARYGYRSGINQTMPANLAGIVSEARALVDLEPGDTVLDIGCNDGTLLDFYEDPELDRLGFDPSPNVAAAARAKGHDVIIDYFSAAAYERVRPATRAKIVTSIAMFYDLPDPMGFTADVAAVLHPDGVWIIELSHLPLMLQNHSYDTICHEHLEYYALRQIEWLLARNGLRLNRVELNSVNGGSFRLFIAHESGRVERNMESIEAVRNFETTFELRTERPYHAFRTAVEESRTKLRALLTKIRAAGETVYVYGASTKGNTILQFCGIDHSIVPKAADRNPDKWGYRTPGSGIEIVSEASARSDKPDYFLVLPWHFFDEFVAREQAYLDSGGRFILPLPEVRVIGRADL
jgi:SAM-dependent methyltransferase